MALSSSPTERGVARAAMSQDAAVGVPAPRLPELTVAKPVGGGALLAFPAKGSEWPQHCQVRRQCPPVEPIKPCIRPMAAVDAFRLDQFRDGDRVVVRGPLWIGAPMFSTMVKCARNQCCNRVGGPVSVGALFLQELGCVGDNSGVCCTVPAFGQDVIATGVVKLIESEWTLVSPNLCVE